MNVLIIGCGRTGRSIAKNLVEIKSVKKVYVFSRTLKSSKALLKNIKSSKVHIADKIDGLKDLDYAIITLGGMTDFERDLSFKNSKTTYAMRQDELKYNLGAIVGLLPVLDKFPKKTKIIVVTNPVDELTNYLSWNLKNRKIFGFGLQLDVRRYFNFLNKDVVCIGTHGRAIPLLNLQNSKAYDKLAKEIDRRLLDYVRKNGIPHELAGMEFRKFFEKLIGAKKQIIYVSYFLKKDFFGIKDLSLSLPFIVKAGKVVGVEKIKVSFVEQKRLKDEANKLKKSVNHIIETHKNLSSYK